MNIHRALIHVRQGVQQMGAFQGRGYEDEELVFQLNWMQGDFVKKYLRQLPGGLWEVTDSRKLGALTVTDHRPVGRYTDAFYAIMPGDMAYLLGATALFDCNGTGSALPVPFSYIRIPPTAKVPTVPAPEEPELFYALAVSGALGSVTMEARFPTPDPGFLDEVAEVASQLLRAAGQDNWLDRIGSRTFDGGIDGGKVLYLKSAAASGTLDTAALSSGTFSLSTIVPGSSPITLPVTVFDGAKVQDALETPFYKPTPGHAVGVLQGRELKIFGPSGGRVTGVMLNYIRKPMTMSYRLNQDCELPDTEAREICTMVIENLTARVNKEDYQAIVTDNSRRGAV